MIEMWAYILCVGICALIWIVNVRWITQAGRKGAISGIYMHTGLGIFFTLLALELILGNFGAWMRFDVLWLQVIGFVLYIPSAYLVVASMYALKHKGKSETTDPFATTTFVNTGVYSIVRQPMSLGVAIWSCALTLVFQSILSIVLGVLSFLCFLIAARTETNYNIKKFGDKYREYMKRVPMWNFLTGKKPFKPSN